MRMLLAGLLGAILTGCGSASPETSEPALTYAQTFEKHLNSARSFCEAAILNSLHDPDSAKFENADHFPVSESGHTAVVGVTLRAKNGFGALRKFTVMCTLSRDADRWSLVDLTEIKN